MDYLRRCDSPLGGILLASDGEALIGLWFEGQRHCAESLSSDCREAELPVFDAARRWLDVYFGGGVPDFTPPLRPRGTPFRQAVWRALLEIPYGYTTTYGAVAARIAGEGGRAATSARAVGGAVGRNPISLIIPCHRVLGADGGLTGYAGGLDRKRRLLRLEQAGLPV